jgi:hypothetical protein
MSQQRCRWIGLPLLSRGTERKGRACVRRMFVDVHQDVWALLEFRFGCTNADRAGLADPAGQQYIHGNRCLFRYVTEGVDISGRYAYAGGAQF